MLPTDVRRLAGVRGGSDRYEDGAALTFGGNLPRRCISSIVAACKKSNSPSLRCPTAFFKFLGRTCRADARWFTALATMREDEGGFSNGVGTSRSVGCENRSGVVGRVRVAVISQAKPNPSIEYDIRAPMTGSTCTPSVLIVFSRDH